MMRSQIRDIVDSLTVPQLKGILAGTYKVSEMEPSEMREVIVTDVEEGVLDIEAVRRGRGEPVPTITIALTQGEVATIAEALRLIPANDELEYRFAKLAQDMKLSEYPET